MITGIIAAVILVAVLPPAIGNGETGVAVLAVVIAIVLLILGAVSREDDRAHVNRQHYWANNGPASKKRAGDKRREYKSEITGKTYTDSMDRESAEARERLRHIDKWELYVCPYCGARSTVMTKVYFVQGKEMRFYPCPVCKKSVATKI